jgi:hypothetical protein
MRIVKQKAAAPSERAQVEAQRGIVRDDAGRIIRSNEWIQSRIELLESKLEDCDRRKANIKAELAYRKEELAGKEDEDL